MLAIGGGGESRRNPGFWRFVQKCGWNVGSTSSFNYHLSCTVYSSQKTYALEMSGKTVTDGSSSLKLKLLCVIMRNNKTCDCAQVLTEMSSSTRAIVETVYDAYPSSSCLKGSIDTRSCCQQEVWKITIQHFSKVRRFVYQLFEIL